MRILLVRHGQSEGNVDESIYKTKADHALDLSETGRGQAESAGQFIRGHLDYDGQGVSRKGNVRLWTSPYNRTRQTAKIIYDTCQDVIRDVREDILLIEQNFGLADGLAWKEEFAVMYPDSYHLYNRAEEHKGRFFARYPLGESRMDVSLRTRNFFPTLHRDFDKYGIDTIVVVCHGVTLRAFTMSWCHYPYEWMEEQSNPGNCDIRLIDNGIDCGYIYVDGKKNISP